jgi:membrane-bound serine protease (ClpP class)
MNQGEHAMRANRLVGLSALSIFILVCGLAFAAKPAEKQIPPRELEGPADEYVIYRIELRDEIMSEDVPFFLTRSIQAAKAANADAVILDMHTPGGRVDYMMQMRDDLIDLKMPTYTYVNKEAISAGSLLAVTMDKIVMAPVSSIGGAQVISGAQELPEKTERKMTSILKSNVRSTAKYKGHPVRICEAFVDSEIEIPGLTPKGEVLTLDQDEAVSVMGLTDLADPTSSRTLAAFIAEDVEDLLKQEGLWPAKILNYELTWSEKLARFLMKIKILLLLIGLGALFVEVKTPGVGVPGAIGVTALALFFWGNYVADMAGYVEVVLFALGMALLLIEIFIIPGFGLAGVSGIALIIASLILAMVKLPPPDIPGMEFNYGLLSRAIWTVIIAFGGMIPLLIILYYLLPKTPGFRGLILDPAQVAAEVAKAKPVHTGLSLLDKEESTVLLGMEGIALTDLRPAGTARFGKRRLDVITEGDYIDAGERVKIASISGNVHVVVKAD